jgi:hypothetical protein
VDTALANAWREQAPSGERSSNARGREQAARGQPLGWFDSLDGFGSLDRNQDVPLPGISCLDGQTIHSQAAQSYTQWVPGQCRRSPDRLSTGHSDRPRAIECTVALWTEAIPPAGARASKDAANGRSWAIETLSQTLSTFVGSNFDLHRARRSVARRRQSIVFDRQKSNRPGRVRRATGDAPT